MHPSELVITRLREREEELERRIGELEGKIARLESAIAVGSSGDVTISGSSVTIDTTGIEMSCSHFRVNAPMARYSSVVQCDTIIATNVVGSSYTPGAGNVM